MHANVILCDPPWWYPARNAGTKFGTGANKYDLMKTPAICALPVKKLADKNCALFMWATGPRMPDAIEVMKAWGFRYATIAFVWTKIAKHGRPHRGPGNYTASNAEYVLLGVRGSMPPHERLVPQDIFSPRLGHSVKPDEVHKRIARMYPDAVKVELFARRNVDGWTCIGNELGTMVEDACA